jgi:acyl-CoA thioesterase
LVIFEATNFIALNSKELAKKVVDTMYNSDWFSQWLGIERLEEDAGKSVLRLTVRKEMLNGFAIAHGGISYSMADSALAFAANSYGIQSVSIETSISHVKMVQEGDVLTATAIEKETSEKGAAYEVNVTNQKGENVALFKGKVYKTGKEWFPTNE